MVHRDFLQCFEPTHPIWTTNCSSSSPRGRSARLTWSRILLPNPWEFK